MITVAYFIMFLLAMIGGAFIFSASGDAAMTLRQALYFLVGSGGFWLVQHRRMPRPRSSLHFLLLFAITVLALVVVLLLGQEVKGAKRWLRFGSLSVQITEFAKITFVLFFAYVLNNVRQRLKTHGWPEVVALGFFVVLCLPIYLEPDYGTIALLGGVLGGMMIAAGIPLWRLALYGCAMGLFVFATIDSAGYRSRRLEAYKDPWKFRTEAGYQTTASFKALGSGGWTGVGFRQGVYKGRRLPEANNDYVLAVIGEERGFIGVVSVMMLYLGLAGVTWFWTIRRLEGWPQLFGVGVTLMIVSTTAMNMLVVSGALPAKGLALPLVSSGGSSLISLLLMVGLLGRYADVGEQS